MSWQWVISLQRIRRQTQARETTAITMSGAGSANTMKPVSEVLNNQPRPRRTTADPQNHRSSNQGRIKCPRTQNQPIAGSFPGCILHRRFRQTTSLNQQCFSIASCLLGTEWRIISFPGIGVSGGVDVKHGSCLLSTVLCLLGTLQHM